VPAYQEILAQATAGVPPPPPRAPIEFTYEALHLQRFGPAALDPEKALKSNAFLLGLSADFADYQHQSRDVKLPPFRPDYRTMVAEMRLDAASGGGFRREAALDLGRALQENVKLRKVLTRDVERMQRSMPKSIREYEQEQAGPPPPSSVAPRIDAFALERLPEFDPEAYLRVALTVVVIKAENLPENPYVGYSRDPYVMVSVVDGDPISEEAERDESWYGEREQWADETAVHNDSLDPQFICRMSTPEAGVFARPQSVVHFKVMDSDQVAAEDAKVAQAVIPLEEVLRHVWHMPKAVALVPFEQRTRPGAEIQKDWLALRDSRLHLSIRWEGVPSNVKSEVKKFAAPTARRARRKPRLQKPPPPPDPDAGFWT